MHAQEDNPQLGLLEAQGWIKSIDGNIELVTEDCAFFTVWLRSIVPQIQKLVFYDQGYNAHIELKESTTELDIINSFISTVQPLV